MRYGPLVRGDRDQGRRLAFRHAESLLAALGAGEMAARLDVQSDPPALAWRRAGLMQVTGQPAGPPLVAPLALTSAADGALAALRMLAFAAELPSSGALLLGERARLLGLRRGGRTSANGSCRLIQAADGMLALNLPRPEDWELMPALLGSPAPDWGSVERLAAGQDCEMLIAQGRLLGLAIAGAEPASQAPPTPFTIEILRAANAGSGTPLVLDLSSLWAGPLAGTLLQAAGARVVKVESVRRPDGVRGGDPRVNALLNAGKASIALDFSDARDLDRLRHLVEASDIVIESARPRALQALGVSSEAAAARGATWISITAYGRSGEAANWIGFGDDAAAAGGVPAAMERVWGEPLFAGDAIADPLTGVTAALAALASWRAGGGRRVSLALSKVVAHACTLYEAGRDEVREWQDCALADDAPLYPLRNALRDATPLGADTAAILKGFGL